MRSKPAAVLENVVIVAIVLVLVQTFIQELASLYGWTWEARRLLIFIGFGFDLFFTFEFLVRLYFAVLARRGKQYFLLERGWLDFIVSIPLLLLISGPAVLAIAAGGVSVAGFGGMVNVLSGVKAIRIARILRVLKIFRHMKSPESPMLQRHVATLATMTTTIIVTVSVVFSFVAAAIEMPSISDQFQARTQQALDFIRTRALAPGQDQQPAADFARAQPTLVKIERDGETLYSRYEEAYLERFFGPVDYSYVRSGNIGVFFDIRSINAERARRNLIHVITIVMLVGIYLFYYRRR